MPERIKNPLIIRVTSGVMGLVFFTCQKKTPARLTEARRAGVISLRAYSEPHHTDNVRNTNPAIKRILKA